MDYVAGAEKTEQEVALLVKEDRPLLLKLTRQFVWVPVAVVILAISALGPERYIAAFLAIVLLMPVAILIEHGTPERYTDLCHTAWEVFGNMLLVFFAPAGFAAASIGCSLAIVANAQHLGRAKYLLTAFMMTGLVAIGLYREPALWNLTAASIAVNTMSGIQYSNWYSVMLRKVLGRIQLLTDAANGMVWEYAPYNETFLTAQGKVLSIFGGDEKNATQTLKRSPEFRKVIEDAVRKKQATSIVELDLPSGKQWLKVTGKRRIRADGSVTIEGFAFDVTELERSKSRLQAKAERDYLTGLSNREGLANFLLGAQSQNDNGGLQVSVMILDIDRFKEINDTLGHLVGDKVISVLAHRFEADCKGRNTCLARLGGDEFAVAVLGDASEAVDLGHTLLDHSKNPMSIDELELVTSASVGMATGHDVEWSELLRRADIAMYEAKRSGSGFEQYASSEDELRSTRLTMQADLARGLESEVEVWFQPIVDAESLQVVGAESLARWIHPDRGLIMPGEFLNIVDSVGLTARFDRHVISTASSVAAQLQMIGSEVGVSANLSARSLWSPDLIEMLEQIPIADRSRITVEITEHGLLDDHERILPALESFRELGIKLALDDYGTGASSLIRLRNLPFTEIKIDMSFVSGITTDRTDASIVKSSLALANDLGIDTVAEGVESAEQARLLNEWGCTRLQGYLFCEAVPYDDLHLGSYTGDGSPVVNEQFLSTQ